MYGSQRILNGKPRSPHYGIDFHAPEGTPVKAMMDGETLSETVCILLVEQSFLIMVTE